MLGTVLKQRGDLAAAEALRAASRLEPADSGPYNTLALILRQRGDIEGSKQMFAEGARRKQAKEKELGIMLGGQ